MFSNPKVTFSHLSPPLPSLHIPPSLYSHFTPFFTYLSLYSQLWFFSIYSPVSALIFLPSIYSPLLWFFSPPFTLCKPKVTGFMGCMHDVGKCQVVNFFSFHSPLFFSCYVSYFLLVCVAKGLDIFVHTSFSQVSQQTWHLFFIVHSRSFGFGASKYPNKEDF